MKRRRLFHLTIPALVLALLGPWATATFSMSARVPARAGSIVMISTQFTPVDEAETFRTILKGSGVDVNFQPLDGGTFTNQVLSQEQAHSVSMSLIGGLYGDLTPFQAAGALQDVTPLIKKLSNRGFPASVLKLSAMGSRSAHYFVPWMEATYVMAVNLKALKYLPKGAKVTALTYDQLIQWGKNMRKATGRSMIGLPAGSTGLLHRFFQGYLYPSYTRSAGVVRFRTPDAVKMWQKMKDLWAVTNPQSTNYGFMQDPLQSGEVWVAWDHVARLIDALTKQPGNFIAVPSPIGPRGLGYMPVIAGLAIPKGAPNTSDTDRVITYLTAPTTQIAVLKGEAFFPATKVKIPATLPTGTWLEARAVNEQASSKKAIPSLLPVGLGSQGGAFNKIYQDTFHRIVLNNEPIQSVLNDEGNQLQAIMNAANAPCWAPDPPSKGPCHVK